MNTRLKSDWQRELELRLRRFSGNAFQTFFGDVMEAKYSDDFSRVKPFGKLGDKGCDGFLHSSGTVYACHGTQNGKSPIVTDLLNKMREDFEKAKSSLNDIMKEWQFVHNFIDGLPTEAVKELSKFRRELPNVLFSFFGIERFKEIMATLPESELERLLGPFARQNDFRNLQMSVVKELIDAMVSELVDYAPRNKTISPVSSSKLDFNKIPEMWASPLRSGRYNEHLIQDYFTKHPLPTQGENLAKYFNDKYLEFANQKLKPSTIMFELYELIVGPEERSIERQVAAYTILAYLFERCDIFENATDG